MYCDIGKARQLGWALGWAGRAGRVGGALKVQAVGAGARRTRKRAAGARQMENRRAGCTRQASARGMRGRASGRDARQAGAGRAGRARPERAGRARPERAGRARPVGTGWASWVLVHPAWFSTWFFDSEFFLSHQMNIVHCKINFKKYIYILNSIKIK